MRLVILGAGGYGQTVADVAWQSGKYTDVNFLDDQEGPGVLGKLADFAQFNDGNTEMIPAFGNNAFRMEWMDRLAEAEIPVATLVHKRAYVSPTVQLEDGVVVLPMSAVNTGCVLKRGVIINCGAVVDHGCVLEEGVHICVNAAVKAENRIPAQTKIEACQVVQNRTYPL